MDFKSQTISVHRIADSPLHSQTVHELHDIQSLFERHLTRFGQSVDESLPACRKLIFVAGNLLRHVDVLYKHPVGSIHTDALRIVDIIYNLVTFGSCYHPDIITHTASR